MHIKAVSEVIIMPPPPEFIEADTVSRLCAVTETLTAENVELVKKLAAANVLIEKMRPVVEATAAWCNGTGSIRRLFEANETYQHWLRNQEQKRILEEAVKKYERDDQNGR